MRARGRDDAATAAAVALVGRAGAGRLDEDSAVFP
jgi:hypothetical protein